VSASSAAFLETPLLTSPGIPLRVAVYSRISQGIRTAVFPIGSALPRETELAASLNVSRTVVREALMLLEEDGLIRTRRGVGRFVAENASLPGLEQLKPLDLALSSPDAVAQVRHLELSRQRPTDFVSDHLALSGDQEMWFREAIIEQDGTPVALIQEYLAADDQTEIGRAVTRSVTRSAESGSTVLRDLMDGGLIFTSGECQIGTNVAGVTRARHLSLSATSPVLVLTQTAQLDERTVYLAKCAVVPSVGHLVVRQSSGA
jgi:GntR family transcriptional regulator